MRDTKFFFSFSFIFQFNFYLFILWLNFSSISIYLFKFITALKCEDQSFTPFKHLISEVKFYAKFFQSFSFSHICRQGNSIAQNFTRHLRHVSSLLVWIENVPQILNNVLLADRSWIFFIESLSFLIKKKSCALMFVCLVIGLFKQELNMMPNVLLL